MFGASSIQKEFTWGGKLSKDEEITWNPIEEEEDEDFLYNHCLFIKQAVLGADAKEGERNIVEVETVNWNSKKLETPIVSLKLDLQENCPLDITLLPPCTLRLKSGSGPVYLTGTHAMEIEEDEEYTINESTEEELSMSDLKELEALKNKKRPSPGQIHKGVSKKPKVENGDTGTEEDEEEEDEEEEEEEEEEGTEEDEEEEEEEEEDMEEGEKEEEEEEEKDEKEKDKKGKEKEKKKESAKGKRSSRKK